MPTVILTRTIAENTRTAPLFTELGFTVRSAPMIVLRPVPHDACGMRSVRRIAGDAPVVLTSAYATDLWLDLRETEFLTPPQCYYVVGQRSAEMLREDDPDVPVRIVADSARELGRLIPDSESRVLYPCSTERRPELEEELQKRGVSVIALPFYQPVPPMELATTLNTALTDAPTPVILTFFSPSAVRHCFSTALTLPKDVIFCAVGDTTRQELEAHGVVNVLQSDRIGAAEMASMLRDKFQ